MEVRGTAGRAATVALGRAVGDVPARAGPSSHRRRAVLVQDHSRGRRRRPPLLERLDDAEFDVDTADAEADLAAWRAEIELAREISARLPLEALSERERRGERFSHRHILIHLTQEYARHNGHADLLRERLDGVTGE
jgi:hypothetical protein